MAQPAEKMSPPAFDTHKTVKNLKAAGFTERMAEALVAALVTALGNVVTKDELETALRNLEHRLTIKLGGLITAGVIILAALDKLAGGGQIP